jgi:uncharacterized protein (TIGR03437 family)
MFTLRASGRNYVVAMDGNQIIATVEAAPTGANSRPARPGDVSLLFGVGFGPRSIDSGGVRVITTETSPFVSTVRVKVGGLPADVLWASIIPIATLAGQLNVRLPSRLSEGDLTLEVEVAGVSAQRNLVIPVRNPR